LISDKIGFFMYLGIIQDKLYILKQCSAFKVSVKETEGIIICMEKKEEVGTIGHLARCTMQLVQNADSQHRSPSSRIPTGQYTAGIATGRRGPSGSNSSIS